MTGPIIPDLHLITISDPPFVAAGAALPAGNHDGCDLRDRGMLHAPVAGKLQSAEELALRVSCARPLW